MQCLKISAMQVSDINFDAHHKKHADTHVSTKFSNRALKLDLIKSFHLHNTLFFKFIFRCWHWGFWIYL